MSITFMGTIPFFTPLSCSHSGPDNALPLMPGDYDPSPDPTEESSIWIEFPEGDPQDRPDWQTVDLVSSIYYNVPSAQDDEGDDYVHPTGGGPSGLPSTQRHIGFQRAHSRDD